MSAFRSVLYDTDDGAGVLERCQPDFFPDLNLDQVVAALTAGRQEYDLAPFFSTTLRRVRGIAYRHAVFVDLEDAVLGQSVGAFARKMRDVRDQLSQTARLRYPYQRQSWFLDALLTYCDAVDSLAQEMSQLELHSAGLLGFRTYLACYRESPAFTALAAEARALAEQLAGVEYCLHITGGRIRVSRYDSEANYSAEVLATFDRFRQHAVGDYRMKLPAPVEMNHVEAGVVQLVARLFPDVFSALDGLAARHRDFLDDIISRFDREVQFYLAYAEFMGPLRRAGLTFCYPEVSEDCKDVFGQEAFDVALASSLVLDRVPVVCNDFSLKDPERIFVVSGPNQGGKTTFARTIGQLHHLASIGCLVPGSRARLSLPDRLFTHFERGENLEDLAGKLQDELLRIREILTNATPRSVVIMNEIFTSTALKDAVFLGTKVLEQLIELDCLGVCVTFIDELASLGAATVSMVSTVVPENPASRTYKVIRRPAGGRSYADVIAEKYGLTYPGVKARVTR